MRIIILTLLFTCLLQNAQAQQIKKMVGWGIDSTRKDTVVHLRKEYDKEGRVLKDRRSEFFGINKNDEYAYDSLGRITYMKRGDGLPYRDWIAHYKYYPLKIEWMKGTSPIFQEGWDSLDVNQRLVKSYWKTTDFPPDDKSVYYSTKNYYYQGDQLVKTEICSGGQCNDAYYYRYGKNDSLKIQFSLSDKGDTTEKSIYTYHPVHQLKVKEAHYDNSVPGAKTTYNYDSLRKLQRKTHTLFSRGKPLENWELTYQNGVLMQLRHFGDGFFFVTRYFYKKGVLVRTVKTDKIEKVTNTIHYHYVYSYW